MSWNRDLLHKAKHFATDGSGNVSALCFVRPRRIDMKKASWTTTDAAVTCPRCRKILGLDRGKVGS